MNAWYSFYYSNCEKMILFHVSCFHFLFLQYTAPLKITFPPEPSYLTGTCLCDEVYPHYVIVGYLVLLLNCKKGKNLIWKTSASSLPVRDCEPVWSFPCRSVKASHWPSEWLHRTPSDPPLLQLWGVWPRTVRSWFPP